MRPSFAPFTAPEPLVHRRSLADFITTTSEFRFSVQTGFCTPKSPASKPGRGRVQRSVSLAVSTTHALFAEEVQSNVRLSSPERARIKGSENPTPEPGCGMDLGGEHVRFPEQSGHALCARRCPLVTQSGPQARQRLGRTGGIVLYLGNWYPRDSVCSARVKEGSRLEERMSRKSMVSTVSACALLIGSAYRR
jgi:hypothetical protein